MAKLFKQFMVLKGLNPNTIERYLYYQNSFESQIYDGIDQETIDNFLSKNNIEIAKGFLKNYIEWLEEVTPKELWQPLKIRKRSGRIKPKETHYITQEETYKLVDSLLQKDLKFALISMLLFEGGFRISELLKVKIDDIDFNNHRIKIRESKTGFREVMFSDFTANLLSKYVDSEEYVPGCLIQFELRNPEADAIKNHRCLVIRVEKKIKEYGKLYLGKDIHPHMFRHGCGYYLRNVLGFSLEEVAMYLGHSKLDTTRRYAHTEKESVLQKVKNSFQP